MWLSQQIQQVPFLTWPHLEPSIEVSEAPVRNFESPNTVKRNTGKSRD